MYCDTCLLGKEYSWEIQNCEFECFGFGGSRKNVKRYGHGGLKVAEGVEALRVASKGACAWERSGEAAK